MELSNKEIAIIEFLNDEEGTDSKLTEKYLNSLKECEDPDDIDYEDEFDDVIKYCDIDMDDLDRYNSFSYGSMEYLCLNENEADIAQDDRLESHIDECLDIPEDIMCYFDREKWKSDAKMDGRGHILASYDGDEHEVEVNGEWLFIYRQN